MSQWTHLAGIIRLDNLRRRVAFNAPTEDLVMKILLEGAPRGSEGGCSVYFHEWPETKNYDEKDHTNIHEGSTYWADVIISADLRDVGDNEEDIEKIKAWFTGINKKLWDAKLITRQAVLQIEVEYKYWDILTLEDPQDNKWIITRIPKQERLKDE